MELIDIRVENIVVKGENTGHQHFFLFPQSFQKLSWIVFCNNRLTLSQTSPGFTCLQYRFFLKHCGKGESARYLFPTMFSIRLENFLLFSSNLIFVKGNLTGFVGDYN